MNLKHLALMTAVMAAASDYTPSFFKDPSTGDGRHRKPTSREDIPGTYQESRQLREFTIHGHTVKAYSRKDAIKRLKHQKKI